MKQTYDNSLKIVQVCADDIIKFIKVMREDLFTTYFATSIPTTREAYEKIQAKWNEKTEEKALVEEFSLLIKQTGFKSA